MRVITGKARGVKLSTPDGLDVRPTVDRVKEAVFSSLQFDIEGRTVLDLFAGSGQLGIEALSRGASLAIFVDNSQKSLETVKKNLKATSLETNSRVICSDSLSYLSGKTEKIDIALLDPPYNKGIINSVMPLLVQKMSDYGVIVCEHSIEDELEESFGEFCIAKSARYGKIMVTYYRKTEGSK